MRGLWASAFPHPEFRSINQYTNPAYKMNSFCHSEYNILAVQNFSMIPSTINFRETRNPYSDCHHIPFGLESEGNGESSVDLTKLGFDEY